MDFRRGSGLVKLLTEQGKEGSSPTEKICTDVEARQVINTALFTTLVSDMSQDTTSGHYNSLFDAPAQSLGMGL